MFGNLVRDMRRTEGQVSLWAARIGAVLLVGAFGQRCWELWRAVSPSVGDFSLAAWGMLPVLLALPTLPHIWRASKSGVILAAALVFASGLTIPVTNDDYFKVMGSFDGFIAIAVPALVLAAMSKPSALTTDTAHPSAARP